MTNNQDIQNSIQASIEASRKIAVKFENKMKRAAKLRKLAEREAVETELYGEKHQCDTCHLHFRWNDANRTTCLDCLDAK